MSTVSPAHTAAYRLLRNQLYEYLDAAEFHAMKPDEWDAGDIAFSRDLVPDLVDVIRASVAAHQDGDAGECLLCERPWPCRTVQVIHETIDDPQRTFHPLLRGVG